MRIIKAVLGWSNPETAGGESMRLYSLEGSPNPRWDNSLGKGGRTVERELIHEGSEPVYEGDRVLVVHCGRWPKGDDLVEDVKRLIEVAFGPDNVIGVKVQFADPETPDATIKKEKE